PFLLSRSSNLSSTFGLLSAQLGWRGILREVANGGGFHGVELARPPGVHARFADVSTCRFDCGLDIALRDELLDVLVFVVHAAAVLVRDGSALCPSFGGCDAQVACPERLEHP